MYRSVCSQGMAVQWLSHQTGVTALAGCSGGLEKERERRIKETKKEETEKQVKVGMRR